MSISGHIEAFVKELGWKGAFMVPWTEDAVRAVPRHHFIEQYYDSTGKLVSIGPDGASEEQLGLIYSNSCLQIRKPPEHSSASEPCLVMRMLADLDVQRGQKVLEIGTGSGWNAGLLAFRAGGGKLVYSIDAQADLVEQAGTHLLRAGVEGANLRAGDGVYGWPEAAPFDRIIATVGCPDIPPTWHEQLAEDGSLLMPLKTSGIGDPLIRLTKRNGRLVGAFTRWCWFGGLQGDYSTGAEDMLESPLEPWLDSLLQEDPQAVGLAEVMTYDCLFFLRLKGLRFQGFRRIGSGQLLDGFLHHESGSVFSCDLQWAALRLYGNSDLGKLVSDGQREWIRLRRPRISDYQVELVDSGTTCSEPLSWLDRRKHACLRFTLDREVSL